MLEALIASVVALGSLFSLSNGHMLETTIFSHANSVLEDPIISKLPTTDQVIAWILRTIYLRATTRPHITWLASCTTIHLAEAIGAHHDVSAVLLTTSLPGEPVITPRHAGIEQIRRAFRLARSLNTIISYEYGRSSVQLTSITCDLRTSYGADDQTFQFIDLTQLIPPEKSPPSVVLAVLQQVSTPHAPERPHIALSRADICFCLYQRLRTKKKALLGPLIAALIRIGTSALEAARSFISLRHPWWHVSGAVSQYVCVPLAIDTKETLSHVREAIGVLEEIVGSTDMHLTRESLNTARVLLRDSAAKKRRKLKLLDDADTENGTARAEGEKKGLLNWDELFRTDLKFLDDYRVTREESAYYRPFLFTVLIIAPRVRSPCSEALQEERLNGMRHCYAIFISYPMQKDAAHGLSQSPNVFQVKNGVVGRWNE
jgi:hypothetical protein